MNSPRYFLLVALLAFFHAGCGQRENPPEPKLDIAPRPPGSLSFEDVEERADGLMYRINASEPFTGVIREFFPGGVKDAELSYWAGRRHGIARQWTPEGVLRLRQFWESGDLIEDLRGEQAQQAEAHFAEREKLGQTVWKGEADAQVYEDTFVRLWDDLRAAKDQLAVLEKFAVGKISLPAFKESAERDWGIRVDRFEGGGAAADWRAKLAALRAEGVAITETEWHQFQFEPDGPRSRFRFVIHATRGGTRFIVRGQLTVEWSDQKDARNLFLPASIAVTQFNLLQRTGPLAFQEVKRIDTAREFPRRKRAPEVHPILAYDLDRDGRLEIIVAGANLVYWNRGGKWERGALCRVPPGQMGAALLADFTGDGRADLFATPGGKMPVLYEGGKKGIFDKLPRKIVLESRPISAIACTAGDIDDDGDLDIWLTQYRPPYLRGKFPNPYYNANDGWPAYLLLNDGKGNFTDGTSGSGLSLKRHRRTYSTSLVDLDDDHDLDLVVINDFAGLDVYQNNGRGRFKDVTALLGEDRYSFGMSHALADFNRDGRLDLYMTGMGSTTARRLEHMKLGRAEFPEHQAKRMKLGYGNRMYLGAAAGALRQPDWNDAVARSGWSWGCTAFDFDNDGDEDLYIANGHMSRLTSKDYCTQFWTQDIFTRSSRENPVLASVLNECLGAMETISWNGFEHNALFMNDHRRAPGSFLNVSWLMNLSHEYDSRSVLGEDVDGDGRPDLLVSHIGWEKQAGEKPHYLHLLKNQLDTGHHWIGVQLHEHGPGRSPIGARITVRHAGGESVRHVVTGESWRAQHSNQKHFGLGTATAVDFIEVRWPGGAVSRLENPALDRYHMVAPK